MNANIIVRQHIECALVTDFLALIPGAGVIVGVSEALVASSLLIYHIAIHILNSTKQEYRRISMEYSNRVRESYTLARELKQDPSFTKSTYEMEKQNARGYKEKIEQMRKEKYEEEEEYEYKLYYYTWRLLFGIFKVAMPSTGFLIALTGIDLITTGPVYLKLRFKNEG